MRQRGASLGLFGHNDAYGNGFLSPSNDTLQKLSGFGGSAGLAAVSPEAATLFVDGRYSRQAKAQVKAGFKTAAFSYKAIRDFFKAHKPADKSGPPIVGFDEFRHSAGEIDAYKRQLKDFKFVGIGSAFAIRGSSLEFFIDENVGMTVSEKLKLVALKVAKKKAAATLLASPFSVAWLLNFRANSDILHTPAPPCRAVVKADGEVYLFLPHRPSAALRRHWGGRVRAFPEAKLPGFLRKLKGKIMLDKTNVPYGLWAATPNPLNAADPCLGLKAVKSPAEISAIAAAHIRDGAALARFLCSVEKKLPADEVTAARRLHRLRAEDPLFWGESFPTISAVGKNSAMPHYIPGKNSARLRSGSVYLIDSGGHYFDGTTDVTRVIWLGDSLPPALKKTYTLVLKAHIRLAKADIAEIRNGERLDGVARRTLRRHNLDYPHSTGHGVGNFLSVHESPPVIGRGGGVLKTGMVFSNEPAVYFAGNYGIRLENLLAVEGRGLRPLTCVPFAANLIRPELLSSGERRWLNRYHRWVGEALYPLLPPSMLGWLEKNTAEI